MTRSQKYSRVWLFQALALLVVTLASRNYLSAAMSNIACFHSVKVGPDHGMKSSKIDLLLTSDGTIAAIEVKGYDDFRPFPKAACILCG